MSSKMLPAPASIAPQLAMLASDVPAGEGWIYELKYDGYRILAYVDDGEVRLYSRSGKEWTRRFPTIANALSRVRTKNAVFDGEVGYVLEDGRTDFQMLQNAIGGKGDAGRLVYFAFDLLFCDDEDLRELPLRKRKEQLRTIFVDETPPLKLGDHVEEGGRRFYEEVCRLGLEGIIAKRAERAYRSGRSPDWLKLKCQKRQELVVVGFTRPRGQRTGLGALLLGVTDGEKLRYAGKVGTGFTQASLDDLVKRLTKLQVGTPPVEGAPTMSGVIWAKPELVAQIRFTEWTHDGALRHPSFEGLRDDKTPAKVVREEPLETPATARATRSPMGVKVAHPEHVIDPTSGVTTLDLATYYAAVARRMLPFAAKRPLMLLRCPEGGATKAGSLSVPKRASGGLEGMKGLHTAEIEGEEVLYVKDERAIVGLAQRSVVEMHGWGCRLPKWNEPDWIVFELDPSEGMPFRKVVEAAKEMKELLALAGLTTFVKTTGDRGLHLVVPLTRTNTTTPDWNRVRAFAEGAAEAMVSIGKDRFVATRSEETRHGKIFIDGLRNAKGEATVLPYSMRARAGATVAMPVAWTDLDRLDPSEFTVRTVPGILAHLGEDPWRDFSSTKQSLPKM